MSRMDLPNSDSRPAPSNEVPRQNGPVCVPAHGPSTWPDGVSLPSLDDVWERAHVVQLPMNIRFRGIMQREVMLIDGPHGWSEWGAFLEYGPAESAMWLASALEMGWVGPPALLRGWVPVNGTIPACDPARVPELLDRYSGISTVKVKVAEKGQTLDDDCARIRAVREARPDINIRVDANGGWTVAEAHEAVRRFLHDGPLDYVEQPCPHLEDLADLRNMLVDEGLSARIAADESIRKASDPYRAIRMGAIDVAVVKAAPLGGPRNVIAVAEEARKHGVAVTVSSAIDSVVGMYAGLCAASAVGSQPAGLATGALMAGDVGDPRPIVDGMMAVEPRTPDPDALARYRAPEDRVQWWKERLAAAWKHVPGVSGESRAPGASDMPGHAAD